MSIESYYNDFLERLKKYGYSTEGISYSWFLVFRKLTQAQKLWWHLKRYKKVTAAEVERIYFFCHPPGVIRDIRKKLIKEGSDYQIDNEHLDGFDAWGNPSKYDKYNLRECKI